jgi:hypothetical protein
MKKMTVTNTSAYFAGASERNEEKIFFDQYNLECLFQGIHLISNQIYPGIVVAYPSICRLPRTNTPAYLAKAPE